MLEQLLSLLVPTPDVINCCGLIGACRLLPVDRGIDAGCSTLVFHQSGLGELQGGEGHCHQQLAKAAAQAEVVWRHCTRLPNWARSCSHYQMLHC